MSWLEVTAHIKLIAAGAIVALAAVAALFFLRFFRMSRDRLFGAFAFAFLIMSLNWLLVAVINPAQEIQPYFYLVRLLAFSLIIWAIIDKNRDKGGGRDRDKSSDINADSKRPS